jgi:hypothetical protein
MPSDVEQITLIRELTLAQLADLRADPDSSYSMNGKEVTWAEYVASLEKTVDWCDAKLAGYRPFEFRSQGMT